MTNRAISLTASAWAFTLALFVFPNVASSAPPDPGAPPSPGAPTTGGGGAGPEQEACAGRAVGDACTLPNRALGICGQSTCNRLDYSQGSPPKAIEEPCVVCQASQGHGDGPALGGTTGAPAEGDPATSDSAGDGAGTKEPPKSESRCRIDTTPEPIGFAGSIALLLLAGVRRRRA